MLEMHGEGPLAVQHSGVQQVVAHMLLQTGVC